MIKKRFAAFAMSAVMAATAFCLPSGAAEFGDVDLSGVLTSNDAAFVLNYTLLQEATGYTDEQIKAADVNGDGIVTANDAALILQKVLTNMPFPVESTTETTTESTTETTTESTTELTTQTTTVETTETTTNEITEVTTTAYYSFVADNLVEYTVPATVTVGFTEGGFTATDGSYKIGDSKEPVLVNGQSYTRYVQLNGTSTPQRTSFYIDAPCGGRLDIVARSANATAVRNLIVEDANGNVCGEFSMPVATDNPVVNSAILQSAGRYYIYDNMGNINIYMMSFTGLGDVVTTSETTTETTTHRVEETTEVPTFNGDTSDGVVVDNFNDLKTELAKQNNKVYVKGTIMCNERISLNTAEANVELYGIPNSDGTAATLDFAPIRDSRTSAGSGGAGFMINGSHYTFRNLIIQNAGDCGIRITGNGSGYCTFENVVFRYNNNSGISLTKGAAHNTFRYVDSYRNGDLIQKNGADADGFSVKLAAGEDNYFYNCRAWENSDDGWDSYDRKSEGGIIGSIEYIECVTFNNGNPYVFTGEYDYEHGNALDKNLLYVQQILKEDPDFEAKYNARTVTSWPKVTVSLLGTSNNYDRIHSSSWAGNPNGFKFGSAETPKTSYRYIVNCIAFGHENTPNQKPAKGFDQNNGSAQYDIVNALSFDNGQNYWMDKMTALSKTGVFYGFNGGQQDTPGDLNITTPDTAKEQAIRDEVNKKFGYILDSVYSDKIPGKVIFDVFG